MFETPGVPGEQQVRAARARDLGVDRQPLARLQLPGQEAQLPVDDHARADLEDIGALSDQARVLHHLRAPPAGLDDHLGPHPVAGFERARGEQREIALRGAKERGAAAKQRPVEVGVDAADRQSSWTRASAESGGRATSSTWIRSPSAVWSGGAWSSRNLPSARRRSSTTRRTA